MGLVLHKPQLKGHGIEDDHNRPSDIGWKGQNGSCSSGKLEIIELLRGESM